MKIKITLSEIADVMSVTFLIIIGLLLVVNPFITEWKTNIGAIIVLIILVVVPVIIKRILRKDLSDWQLVTIVATLFILGSQLESI